MFKSILLFFLLFTFGFSLGNENISSFSKSQKILNKKIYNTEKLRYAFYSNCKYNYEKYKYDSEKERWKLVVNKESCGYIPRTKSQRANFIEFEHIVPAHAFGQYLPCWKNGGRKNCKKVSEKFRLMEADLYNLVPAIGELNEDRSNFTFTELVGEPRKYGKVDFEVDFKMRKVEPRNEVKGQIARTYFYFQKTYNLPISKKQLHLFNSWNKQYPETTQEIEINKIKEKIQGNKFIY